MNTPDTLLFPPNRLATTSDLHGGLSLELYHIMESWLRAVGAWSFLNVVRQDTIPPNPQAFDVWLIAATFDNKSKVVTEPSAAIYDPDKKAFVTITPEMFGRAMVYFGRASGVVIGGSLKDTLLTLDKKDGTKVDIDLKGIQDTDVKSGSLNGSVLELTKVNGDVITVELGGLKDGVITDATLRHGILTITQSVGPTLDVDLRPLMDGVLKSVNLVGTDLEFTMSDNTDITVDLEPMLDGVITDAKLLGQTLELVMSKGANIHVPLAGILPGGNDGVVTGGSLSGTTLHLNLSTGGTVQVPLDDLVDGVLKAGSLSNSNVLTLITTKNSNVVIDLDSIIDPTFVDVKAVGKTLEFTTGSGATRVIDLTNICG